jgi:SPW repeat
MRCVLYRQEEEKMRFHLDNTFVGWTSMALGLIAATTPVWASTSPVGTGFTLGLGAMTVMYGGWSLIARDPTRDHWAMSVVGLVLTIAPWIGGYAGDSAAWVSWIVGVGLMVLAGAAYIADEANEVTRTERIKALVEYRVRHGKADDGSSVPATHLDRDLRQSGELVDALPIRHRHGADY